MKIFDASNQIDLRVEKITFFDLIRPRGRRRISLGDHRKDMTDEDMRFYIERLAQGYPASNLVAQENIDGNLELYPTLELLSLMSFYNNGFEYNGHLFGEMEDPGFIEGIKFDLYVVRPSSAEKFRISTFYIH